MTQHVTHICPSCGRRFKCDSSTKTFVKEVTLAATASPWPTIQYEVYWGIGKLTDALVKTMAMWIPVNVIVLTVSMRNDWSPVIPQVFSVVSLVGFLRLFGKVPSWHNAIETERPAQPEPEPDEPEDTRRFVGWVSESHTKSTQHVEWYHSPVPIPQARSYALALVSNGYQWIDERDLATHQARISQSNYRKLRRDWLDRDWCTETGDRKTVIRNRHMIRRIAFEQPE